MRRRAASSVVAAGNAGIVMTGESDPDLLLFDLA
jgi:hypothetical protein